MRPTKKITVSAMATALGSALMAVGSLLQFADMAFAAFASFLVVIIIIEVGFPYPWLVWLTTTLITFIIPYTTSIWPVYFIFGVFPILKYYIEKLKRPFWFPFKLVYVNVCILLLVFVIEFVAFGTDVPIVKAALYVVLNIAFFMYDRLLTLLIRLYNEKYRQRFRHLFK